MKYILTSNKGFYIGDICYVLSDEVYHDIWGTQNSYQDGRIQVGNYAFAVDRTAYGDGFYVDSSGKEYSVDAGVIGCVPFELIDMDKLHKNYDPGANPIDILNDFGRFVKGSRAEFKTDDNGIFTITVDNQITIIIDTNYEAGYEEDEEDSEDYYSNSYYDDSDDEEEYFEEYDGEEPADEQFSQPISNSNIEKVLSQAQYNPDMFQIHGTGEINYSGVTVKFIYYANPRKPLDGTYIDIDSTDKGFEKVFRGHLNKYLPENEICRIILRQLTDYLNKSTNQQPAKESISDEVLSKLDSFDADQGNYPLEGASIYYDSRYLRFYFTGIDEDSAKEKVLSFLSSQGFDVQLNQLYVTKYGSSVTVFLYISSLPEPSSNLTVYDYKTVTYPDDFPVQKDKRDIIESIVIKQPGYPIDLSSLFPNLKTAEILASAQTVYGFSNCKKLTNVVLQDGVTSVDNDAFFHCTSLTNITIPNTVTRIADWAFAGCSGLTSITIPNSVTSVGSYAFSNCTSLTSLTIPSSVVSIGNTAFDSCTGLTSITIEDGVKSISSYAFFNCIGLTNITIPDSVTNIGSNAFFGCAGLTNVKLPNGLKLIKDYLFQYCSNLAQVEIPNSLTSIGIGAFLSCRNLNVYFKGTIKEWESIELARTSFNRDAKVHCTDGTIRLD